MQKCSYCGADLPENTRFCGKCGSVQDALATDTAATSSNTLQSRVPESGTIPKSLPPSSIPAWSPEGQTPETPLPTTKNEDEPGRDIADWSSQYSAMYGTVLGGGALLGSGQAYIPSTPVVQGTPQINSAPSVAGSPTLPTNAPAGPPTPGPTSAPVGHPLQELANVPVSHPAQGLMHTPFPQTGPQPTHEPPEQPGTQEHHPPQKHHERRTPRTHQTAARVTRVAGGSTVKTVMMVVTAVVVVAAGGVAAAHFLSRPQPLISITSKYQVGNMSAGANGTSLHISGQNFSSNSPVTFFLDGHAAPGSSGTRSDANGTFSADVTITDAWSVGTHTLTARDASNDSPKNSVSVTIVQPGQANTPGPNGAPPDDATFRIKVTIANSLADPFSQNPVLIITGHPEGGTVCSPDDSGQSFTYNEIAADGTTTFTKTITASCSGTYKAGQINFIETSTTIKQYWQYSGVNVTCVRNNPTVDLRLTGAYAGNNTFRGTLSSPYFTYTCDQGYSNTYHEAAQGVTWTGTMVTQ